VRFLYRYGRFCDAAPAIEARGAGGGGCGCGGGE
jgi:hypothetical protein